MLTYSSLLMFTLRDCLEKENKNSESKVGNFNISILCSTFPPFLPFPYSFSVVMHALDVVGSHLQDSKQRLMMREGNKLRKRRGKSGNGGL